eukprot:Filipodium_phascolosomae@DN2810_c4_g2_i2.p1
MESFSGASRNPQKARTASSINNTFRNLDTKIWTASKYTNFLTAHSWPSHWTGDTELQYVSTPPCRMLVATATSHINILCNRNTIPNTKILGVGWLFYNVSLQN